MSAEPSNKRPGGLTPKQEAFVLAFLETGNATEAYRRSYDAQGMKEATINREAKSLTDNPKIATRLAELQQRASAKAVLTRTWVLERLMKNAEMGAQIEDLTASNKALELLGKTEELQMFVERSSVTSDNRHHHSAEPVSAFADFVADALGLRVQDQAQEPVQN